MNPTFLRAWAAYAVALALAGCSDRDAPKPRLVEQPPPGQAVTEILCPKCGALLRPEEIQRPNPTSPHGACPKCRAAIAPPKTGPAPR